MIALPDDLPVDIVTVPDLRPIPAAAIATLYLAGENADWTVILTLQSTNTKKI